MFTLKRQIMSTEKQKSLVSTDVAVKDVISFLKSKRPKMERRGELDTEKVKESYIDLIEAVEDGKVEFDEGFHPTLTLYSPLFKESSNEKNIVKKISFRNRVKAADKARVMNNLDVENKKGDYTLKLIGFLCQLSNAEVNEIEKSDFDVINQICSVF